jgi:hypothetical protein
MAAIPFLKFAERTAIISDDTLGTLPEKNAVVTA